MIKILNMKLLKFMLAAVSVCGLYIGAAAQEYIPVPDARELEAEIKKQSGLIQTIQSHFVQTKTLEALEMTIVSAGKFWFKRENSLRWEYQKPYLYTIGINKGEFVIKDGDKVSKYDIASNKVFKEINDIIVSSVKGDLLSSSKFEAAAYQNQSSYKLVLLPKDSNIKQALEKIEMYFSKEDMSVYKLVMIESDKDYTVLEFENRRQNEAISDSIFIIR
jgi:outer membrane lipoprotein-sorting protein